MSRALRNALPALAVAALVLLAGEAFACPNCKATVADASNPDAGDPASAFGYSIYVMIGSVLSMAGWIVFTVVRAAHRADGTAA